MTQQNFLSNESGAVTVDWVVLTAALVGLGLAVMGVISGGVEEVTEEMNTTFTDGTIIRTAFTGSAADARDAACGAFGGCDNTLTSASLQNLTTDELNGLAAVSYGDDFLSDGGFSFDGDGNLGTAGTDVDGNPTFTAADTATVDAFNAAASAQASQNALIDAERAARTN